MNKALYLGYCKITNSIIPDTFEYYWQPPPPFSIRRGEEAAGRGRLCRTASTPAYFTATRLCEHRRDRGRQSAAVGIRAKLRPLERAGFSCRYGNKKLQGIMRGASGAFGNAATRLAAFVVKGGAYVYGSYPGYRRALPAAGRRTRHARSARRSWTRCSSWSTRRRSTRRSCSSPFSAVSVRGRPVGVRPDPRLPYTAPFEDITIKGT